MINKQHQAAQNVTTGSRWWARAALLFAVLTVVVPVLWAGLASTLGVLLVGAGASIVTTAAIYWILASRGILRWISTAIAVIAPLAMLIVFIRAELLAAVMAACVLALMAVLCARAALHNPTTGRMPTRSAVVAEKPFLIMNPHSGGGKVAKFDLRRKAEELGAEVALLEGPVTVDVTAMAQDAIARGADLLGVAGGDGTQALVAAVAAEHRVPFVVISAGTRNHFAMDLGLDRKDPSRSLDALRDGVDISVDLGRINDRPFVNNASFGVYAEIVRSPAYRNDKATTVLSSMPDLLAEHTGSRLTAQFGDMEVRGPQAVLVSNNPYGTGDLAGLSRRTRLDRGVLGVVTISVASARQAVGLLRRTRTRGLIQHTATEVVVEADTPEVPVGVDGETLMLATPVRCSIEPGALRVRLPRDLPAARPPEPPIDWVQLRRLALGRGVATIS
ncbi:diacylglycerol kinase family protein [Williamsia sp. D3]|uniref:diacylglycerol/lipid kinase family protein n=1 Tax=Williamsia sp. D3 TaxID=1313067 RepID=UPI0003D2C489|nr:diacylglycerol kinase family protein [Williamsia sp. D3]ETD31403.1 diacylglycerol kinase [Williamsia sp. D3]